MEYKELSRLYYQDESSSRDEALAAEEARRRRSAAAFDMGFATPAGTLFIAMPKEMAVSIENVLKTERRVSKLMESLPPMARRATLRSLVLDEIMSTNTMEDVRSTRAQVKDALEEASGDNLADKRFREFARLYLDIVDSRQQLPEVPEDIRLMYDKAVAAEVAPSKQPDGRLFRKEGVEVVSRGAKVVHRGLEPEEKIIEAMQAMLELARSDEIPALVGAIASHYLFEYAHPFYDGNGRMGRYLLSLFLSEVLSKPTALSLSRTIAENTAVYYRAFKKAEHPLNRGELTFFVCDLLSLVQIAQEDVIAGLEESIVRFEKSKQALQSAGVREGWDEFETAIMFALVQCSLFGLSDDMPLHEVASLLGVGAQMARKHVAKLEERGLVEKRRLRRPLTFALSERGRARLGMESHLSV